MAKWNLPSTHRGHTMKPPSPPTPSGSVCFFQGPNQPYHPCLQLATCIAGPGRRRVRCARQGGVGRFFPRRRRWRGRMLVSTSNNPPRRSLLSLPFPQPPHPQLLQTPSSTLSLPALPSTNTQAIPRHINFKRPIPTIPTLLSLPCSPPHNK